MSGRRRTGAAGAAFVNALSQGVALDINRGEEERKERRALINKIVGEVATTSPEVAGALLSGQRITPQLLQQGMSNQAWMGKPNSPTEWLQSQILRESLTPSGTPTAFQGPGGQLITGQGADALPGYRMTNRMEQLQTAGAQLQKLQPQITYYGMNAAGTGVQPFGTAPKGSKFITDLYAPKPNNSGAPAGTVATNDPNGWWRRHAQVGSTAMPGRVPARPAAPPMTQPFAPVGVQSDPIAQRIQELQAQGMPPEQIAQALREKGLDPSRYGL